MTVNRNAACPCGSGKKYKRCCALTEGETARKSRLPLLLFAALVVAGALALIAGIMRDQGPAQRGVWSPEHGHYHTVP